MLDYCFHWVSLNEECNHAVQRPGSPHYSQNDLQEPGMASVRVDRWKCEPCGTYAWTSDDWQTPGVYNYNNHLLIEMSLLYSCRDAFMEGTPIQTFFATFLARLQDDCDWAEANPDRDNRLDYVIASVDDLIVYAQNIKYMPILTGWVDRLIEQKLRIPVLA